MSGSQADSLLTGLPAELLSLILAHTIPISSKNALLEQRLVCKAFDRSLRESVLKTLQVSFVQLSQRDGTIENGGLQAAGCLCEALHLNMIDILEMYDLQLIETALLDAMPQLSHRASSIISKLELACLTSYRLDEIVMESRIQKLVSFLPGLKRLKLTLPVPLFGESGPPPLQVLTATLDVLAKHNGGDTAGIEILVIDHLHDVVASMNEHNIEGFSRVFEKLKVLVMSVRREREPRSSGGFFGGNIWLLILKTSRLERLCIVGSHAKTTRGEENASDARVYRDESASVDDWPLHVPGYPVNQGMRLTCLRFLELKHFLLNAHDFITLCTQTASSLKELYLIKVFLEVDGVEDSGQRSHWIGYVNVEKPRNTCWIAPALRCIKYLKLDVLRATGLGYEDWSGPERPRYGFDLDDPWELDRSLDQRFYDAVMGTDPFIQVRPSFGVEQDVDARVWQASKYDSHASLDAVLDGVSPPVEHSAHAYVAPLVDFDAVTYLHEIRNPTSRYRHSIDGIFPNKTAGALGTLRLLRELAEQGMQSLDSDIEAAHELIIDPQSGLLVSI